ncbi:MAG: response regulator transcription factor [Rhodothermales bacterium]
MPDKARVFIVDDHPIVRHGVSRLLNREEDLSVTGEAENSAGALELLEKELPDIVLVDLVLDGESGLDLIETIHERWPDLPVLVVSMHDAPDYLEKVLKSGAKGFVNKKESIQRLADAIRRVLSGKVYIGENMMDVLARSLASDEESDDEKVSELSEREMEVLELIGQGYKPRQIAEALHVSPKTVNSHRENMKRKLDLDSTSELDRFAIQWFSERKAA